MSVQAALDLSQCNSQWTPLGIAAVATTAVFLVLALLWTALKALLRCAQISCHDFGCSTWQLICMQLAHASGACIQSCSRQSQ